AYARSLRIKTMKEYQEHWRTHKLPDGFPYSANRVYAKKGWKGWPHFLGYDGSLDGIKARRWLPFEQVRAYARRQGLRSCHDWIKHKRPDGMPSHPEMIYAKKGWKGWPNFLGTGNRTPTKWRSFTKARAFVRSPKLKSGHSRNGRPLPMAA